jgi:hypothetical protein
MMSSPSKTASPLPRGYCQCCTSISRQRQRRNRGIASSDATNDTATPPSLAILLLDDEMVLCRIVTPRSTLTLCKGDILCYDTCTTLKSTKPSLGFSDLTRAFPLGLTAYNISECEDATTPLLSGENHLGHRHAQIQEEQTPVIYEDTNITDVCPRPLLVLVSLYPKPLVSLTLLLTDHDTTKNTSGQDDPFQQAHRKRELVGKVVLHSKKNLTLLHSKKNIILSTTISMDHVTYEIASLAGMPIDMPGVGYKILPSTRITFLPSSSSDPDTTTTPMKEQQLNGNNNNVNKKPSITKTTTTTITSPVAELISETIRCVQKNIPAPQTFLLSGPPGVGKTYSIRLALQQDYPAGPVTFESIRGSELLQEANPAQALQRVFSRAAFSSSAAAAPTKTTTTMDGDTIITTSSSCGCCLLFLDECDALVSVDSVAAMLATQLDRISSPSSPITTGGSSKRSHTATSNIVVVGATNRVDSIPQFLRRAGRFDRELPMTPPDSRERAKILSNLLLMPGSTSSANNLKAIANVAELCVGYVPADLTALVRRATVLAIQQQQQGVDTSSSSDSSSSSSNNGQSTVVDCLPAAMKDVGASALRDAALAAPPKIGWADIAGDPGGAKVSKRV